MAKSLSGEVGLTIGDNTVNASIRANNDGALFLAVTLPPQFNPLSKFHDFKTTWF